MRLSVSPHPLALHCTARQVLQYDDRTVCLKLRTPASYEHLHLSWHQTAARLCLGRPPDRGATSEAFAFGECIATCRVSLCSTGV